MLNYGYFLPIKKQKTGEKERLVAIMKKDATAKILIIDDEPQVTEIIEAFLTNAGYEVAIDNQALSGLEKARALKRQPQ